MKHLYKHIISEWAKEHDVELQDEDWQVLPNEVGALIDVAVTVASSALCGLNGYGSGFIEWEDYLPDYLKKHVSEESVRKIDEVCMAIHRSMNK